MSENNSVNKPAEDILSDTQDFLADNWSDIALAADLAFIASIVTPGVIRLWNQRKFAPLNANYEQQIATRSPNAVYSVEAMHDYLAENYKHADGTAISAEQISELDRMISHFDPWAQTVLIESGSKFIVHPTRMSLNRAFREVSGVSTGNFFRSFLPVGGFFEPGEQQVHWSSKSKNWHAVMRHEIGHGVDYAVRVRIPDYDVPYESESIPDWQTAIDREIARGVTGTTRIPHAASGEGTIQEHLKSPLYKPDNYRIEALAEMFAAVERAKLEHADDPQAMQRVLTEAYPDLYPVYRDQYVPRMEEHAQAMMSNRQDIIDHYNKRSLFYRIANDLPPVTPEQASRLQGMSSEAIRTHLFTERQVYDMQHNMRFNIEVYDTKDLQSDLEYYRDLRSKLNPDIIDITAFDRRVAAEIAPWAEQLLGHRGHFGVNDLRQAMDVSLDDPLARAGTTPAESAPETSVKAVNMTDTYKGATGAFRAHFGLEPLSAEAARALEGMSPEAIGDQLELESRLYKLRNALRNGLDGAMTPSELESRLVDYQDLRAVIEPPFLDVQAVDRTIINQLARPEATALRAQVSGTPQSYSLERRIQAIATHAPVALPNETLAASETPPASHTLPQADSATVKPVIDAGTADHTPAFDWSVYETPEHIPIDWMGMVRPEPEPIHFPNQLPKHERSQLLTMLERTDAVDYEMRQDVLDAYKSLQPDPQAQQALQEIQNTINERLRVALQENPAMQDAQRWNSLDLEGKQAVMREAEKVIARTYVELGYGHDGFLPTYPRVHYSEHAQRFGGWAGAAMVEVNLFETGFSSALGTLQHEYQHVFQRYIAQTIDRLPDERLRSAAEIFKINFELARPGSLGNNGDSFAYEVEPIEVDARRAQYALIEHVRQFEHPGWRVTRTDELATWMDREPRAIAENDARATENETANRLKARDGHLRKSDFTIPEGKPGSFGRGTNPHAPLRQLPARAPTAVEAGEFAAAMDAAEAPEPAQAESPRAMRERIAAQLGVAAEGAPLDTSERAYATAATPEERLMILRGRLNGSRVSGDLSTGSVLPAGHDLSTRDGIDGALRAAGEQFIAQEAQRQAAAERFAADHAEEQRANHARIARAVRSAEERGLIAPLPGSPAAEPAVPARQPSEPAPYMPPPVVHQAEVGQPEHAAPVPEPVTPPAPARTGAMRVASIAEHGAGAAGVGLGVMGLASRFGKDGTYKADTQVDATLANAGVAADVGAIGTGALDVIKGAGKVKGLGMAGAVLGVASGGAETAIAIKAHDGHRAATAMGATAGGLAGGIAGSIGGAQVGAMAGAAIGVWFGGVMAVPGAAIGGAVGGVIGGTIGAFGGGWAGGKAADAAGGEAMDRYLKSPGESNIKALLLQLNQSGWARALGNHDKTATEQELRDYLKAHSGIDANRNGISGKELQASLQQGGAIDKFTRKEIGELLPQLNSSGWARAVGNGDAKATTEEVMATLKRYHIGVNELDRNGDGNITGGELQRAFVAHGIKPATAGKSH